MESLLSLIVCVRTVGSVRLTRRPADFEFNAFRTGFQASNNDLPLLDQLTDKQLLDRHDLDSKLQTEILRTASSSTGQITDCIETVLSKQEAKEITHVSGSAHVAPLASKRRRRAQETTTPGTRGAFDPAVYPPASTAAAGTAVSGQCSVGCARICICGILWSRRRGLRQCRGLEVEHAPAVDEATRVAYSKHERVMHDIDI